jgi:ribosomal protein S18 acetylase RimI-like enzyme
MNAIMLRPVEPGDYAPVIGVINAWWGGRTMHEMLPKLFFVHFRQTSFIAEIDGERVGFLIGILSQTFPNEAYIHFVGVDPQYRLAGVGRRLYEHFFEVVAGMGRYTVRCVTSPVNKNSIAFHLGMGFQIEPQETLINDVPAYRDYDGPDGDRVLFVKVLERP